MKMLLALLLIGQLTGDKAKTNLPYKPNGIYQDSKNIFRDESYGYITLTVPVGEILSIDSTVTAKVYVENGIYHMTFDDTSNKWRCYPVSASEVVVQITCVKAFKITGEK